MKSFLSLLVPAVSFTLAAGFLTVGCSTPRGSSPDERRAYVQSVRAETLDRAFAFKPELRGEIEAAAGYAVFSNIGAQVFLLGGGQGFGVVHDNRTGEATYMNMATVAVGMGLGVRDFRAIFVFDDPAVMRDFVERGWQFGAEADAGAVVRGDTGAAARAGADIGTTGATAGAGGTAGDGRRAARSDEAAGTGMRVYQITENGIALQARIAGTRYWRSADLN
ncbi:MAG: hypothetical protein JJT96_17195 [Opitutales bacterium]|nr:hypothetical protein [Opitutales bacterium]